GGGSRDEGGGPGGRPPGLSFSRGGRVPAEAARAGAERGGRGARPGGARRVPGSPPAPPVIAEVLRVPRDDHLPPDFTPVVVLIIGPPEAPAREHPAEQ